MDSLCDVVSFGVAPGFLLVKMCPWFTYLHDQAVWIIAAAFAACAALRLARFNVETSDDDDHLYFSGLPSPAAAAVIAGFAIMFYQLRQERQSAEGRRRQHPASHPAVLRAVRGRADGVAGSLPARDEPSAARPAEFWSRGGRDFSFVAIMVVRGYALPIVASAFVLYGPIHLAWQLWVERRQREEPWF